MANIKSQIKRNRQNEVAHERNKSTRSALKTQIKKFSKDSTEEGYKAAARALDKAASKGVIHKNTAARKKSRLAKKLSS
ncbi:MAG: small subunit ribosomal protein [Actinomycetota bacterium]|jgi:small subunit ribosomal protein S20|nr:small subunit ribosomal protein [Actinomycetota bacterium]